VTAILTEVGVLRHSTPPSMWSWSLFRLFRLYDAYEQAAQGAYEAAGVKICGRSTEGISIEGARCASRADAVHGLNLWSAAVPR